MGFSSLLFESFTLCSFRNVDFVFPVDSFTSRSLRFSFGYLGKNGRPLSISLFNFRLFLSFSSSATDLGNHGQTRFGLLSGRFHGCTIFFLLCHFPTGREVVVLRSLFLWKVSSFFSNWFYSVKAARLSCRRRGMFSYCRRALHLILFHKSGQVVICRRRGMFSYCRRALQLIMFSKSGQVIICRRRGTFSYCRQALQLILFRKSGQVIICRRRGTSSYCRRALQLILFRKSGQVIICRRSDTFDIHLIFVVRRCGRLVGKVDLRRVPKFYGQGGPGQAGRESAIRRFEGVGACCFVRCCRCFLPLVT